MSRQSLSFGYLVTSQSSSEKESHQDAVWVCLKGEREREIDRMRLALRIGSWNCTDLVNQKDKNNLMG